MLDPTIANQPGIVSHDNLDLPRRAVLKGSIALFGLGAVATQAGVAWPLPARQPFAMIENQWLTMHDGTRLAMRLWLPESARKTPVGAVLEYIPYRTRDDRRDEDKFWGTMLASHGFAYARVDIRGTGDSAGVMTDEYEPTQTDDMIAVIEWLARQSWCNGNVGMRGYSWGGNTSLQAAARNPAPLKAIMAGCASGDRYRDDAHWVGGALALVNFHWGAWFKTTMAAPPDPAVFGPDWHAEWLRRMDSAMPVVTRWTEHQHADSYWKIGSPAADYDQIRCAVYAVGGQVDAYTNNVPELLERLSVPRKGMVGSWGHSFPPTADPGPGVDWLPEEIGWWSQWLAGKETGIADVPMLRVYEDYDSPVEVTPAPVPGQWLTERNWPSRLIAQRVFHLTDNGLSAVAAAPGTAPIPNRHIVGLAWRDWLPMNMADDLPKNQREDDGYSLTFDTPALDEAMTILGRPVLKVAVAAEQSVATLVVRMNEVHADGSSWPITYGVLNLAQRAGADRPAPLAIGQFYDVEIPLKFVCRRIAPGARIRIALSETLWPMIVTPPAPAGLTVATGARSALVLPVCHAPYEPFVAPPAGQPTPIAHFVTESVQRSGKIRVERKTPRTTSVVSDVGTQTSFAQHFIMEIDEARPSDSYWSVEMAVGYARGSWDTTILARAELFATAATFGVRETLVAMEGSKEVFRKVSDRQVPRVLC